MQYQIIIYIVAALVALSMFDSCQSASSPVILSSVPPLCEPGIIDEMPPHIRKVCLALENSNQLSNALQAYIKNEAQGEINFLYVTFFYIASFVLEIQIVYKINSTRNYFIPIALMFKGEDLMQPGTGKRTDVDHVFLRFGR